MFKCFWIACLNNFSLFLNLACLNNVSVFLNLACLNNVYLWNHNSDNRGMYDSTTCMDFDLVLQVDLFFLVFPICYVIIFKLRMESCIIWFRVLNFMSSLYLELIQENCIKLSNFVDMSKLMFTYWNR